MKALENKAVFSGGEEFEILFQNEAETVAITHTSPYRIDYSVRVFNQDHIADNISVEGRSK